MTDAETTCRRVTEIANLMLDIKARDSRKSAAGLVTIAAMLLDEMDFAGRLAVAEMMRQSAFDLEDLPTIH